MTPVSLSTNTRLHAEKPLNHPSSSFLLINAQPDNMSCHNGTLSKEHDERNTFLRIVPTCRSAAAVAAAKCRCRAVCARLSLVGGMRRRLRHRQGVDPPRPLPSRVSLVLARLTGSDRHPTDGTDRTLTVDGIAWQRVTGDGRT